MENGIDQQLDPSDTRQEQYNSFMERILGLEVPSEEENRLLIQKAQAGDKKAMEEAVLRNARLVMYAIQKNYPRQELYEDLIQEGFMGLMRAVEIFDGKKGCMFSTYAYWWIRSAIFRGIDNGIRAVRLPVHVTQKMLRARKENEKRMRQGLPELTDEEVRESFGVSPEVARGIHGMEAMTSLNTRMAGCEETELGELIADYRKDIETEVLERLEAAELREKMSSLLRLREKDVLERRYGFCGEAETLREIADDYGVTPERVRQIEQSAIQKLRKSYLQ